MQIVIHYRLGWGGGQPTLFRSLSLFLESVSGAYIVGIPNDDGVQESASYTKNSSVKLGFSLFIFSFLYLASRIEVPNFKVKVITNRSTRYALFLTPKNVLLAAQLMIIAMSKALHFFTQKVFFIL